LRINLMNLLIAPLLYLGALLFFDIRVAVYAIPLAALVSTHLFLARLRRECPETNETMLLSLLRGAKMLLLFVLLFAAASLLMQWLGIVGHARLWLALGLAALVGGGCLYDLRRGLKLGRLST
jgi:predicted small integral membrane protein